MEYNQKNRKTYFEEKIGYNKNITKKKSKKT